MVNLWVWEKCWYLSRWPIVTKRGRYTTLVMVSTWFILEEFCRKLFFGDFLVKFQISFWEWDFEVKYAICYISTKNGSIATKQKLTYRLNARSKMGSSGLTLAMTLTMNFGILEFAISQPKMVRLSRNEQQAYRLNTRPQIRSSGLTLAMTLTLNFQGQIWNWLYLRQNGSIAMEQKANISIKI